jgi:hypothetical protein
MTFFRSAGRRPVLVESPQLDPTQEALLELQARKAAALELVDPVLAGQQLLHPDDRDRQLVDLCLDVRSVLEPAGGSRRVGRSSVPFVPGRAR